MFYIFLPTGVDYRTRRYPWVTFGIMGLCLVFYLMSLVIWANGGYDAEETFIQNFWFIPAAAKLHTYLTSLLVHADIWHFLGNMVFLFLFGSCVEDFIGRIHFGWFFLIGGLAATFMQVAMTPSHFHSMIPMGGASGAISACQGAFLMVLPRSQLNFFYAYFFFFRVGQGEFQVPSWVAIVVWFALDLLGLATSLNDEGGGVAFGAHVGGFIFGAVAMLLFKRLGMAKPYTAEEMAEEEAEEMALAGVAPAPRAAQAVAPEDHTPQIYVHDNGTESGPFSRAQILGMLDLGSLDETALYWRDGMPEWRPIHELENGLSP